MSIAARLGRGLQVVGTGVMQIGIEQMRADLQAQRDAKLAQYETERLDKQLTASQANADRAYKLQSDSAAAEAQHRQSVIERMTAADAAAASAAADTRKYQADMLKLEGKKADAAVSAQNEATRGQQLANDQAEMTRALYQNFTDETDPIKRAKIAEDIYAVSGKPLTAGDGLTNEQANVNSMMAANPNLTPQEAWDTVISKGKNKWTGDKPPPTIAIAERLVQDGQYETVGQAIVALEGLTDGSGLNKEQRNAATRIAASLIGAQSPFLMPGRPGYRSPDEHIQDAIHIVKTMGSGNSRPMYQGAVMIRDAKDAESMGLKPGTKVVINNPGSPDHGRFATLE